MKIAVISDTHGNRHALERVLEAIAQEQPEQIVCLGDTIALGPQPAEVAARLRELGCPVIMGNCDAWFAEWPLEEEDTLLYRQARWAAERLSPEDFAFIRSFLPTATIPLGDDTSLLCFHGSPRSNKEVILATTPDEQLEEILDGYDAPLMIGGHTHLQMVRRLGETLVVNAGSVGLPRHHARPGESYVNPPWAEWATIEDSDGNLSVQLRRTPLDVDMMITDAERSGMPGIEDWIAGWQRGIRG